jgi:hypothetical protein
LGAALGRSVAWGLRHPQPFGALAIVLASPIGLWAFAAHSDAFRVTAIRMPANSSLRAPDSLIGQNLLTIDLKAVAEKLKAQQPHLKQVRVIRLLPDALKIEAIERAPIAQVRHGQAGGWYAVDGEGFILPQASPSPKGQLVILKGVEGPRAPLAVGQENANPRLWLALRLAASLRTSPALLGYRVRAVDVSDPQQLSFLIDHASANGFEDAIEVRCGREEELTAHLGRLRAVLRMIASQSLAVQYVDLRFKEPVIGPRT